jgi:hypothetical protein
MNMLDYEKKHERRRLQFSYGSSVLAAILFFCGHIVTETAVSYLLEIRYHIVNTAPTNPVRAERQWWHWISDLRTEVFITFWVSLLILAQLWFIGYSLRWLPRPHLMLRAVFVGIVYCAGRWILYFFRRDLPFRFDDSTNLPISIVLGAILSLLILCSFHIEEGNGSRY